MKTRTFLTALTTALFLALFGFALWEVRLTREAAENLTAALNRQGDVEAQTRKTESLLAAASRRSSDLEAKLVMLQAAKKRLTSYDGDLKILAALARPWRDIVLRRDPKLQTVYLQAERMAIPQRYAPFAAALGLSPEQAKKLEAAEMASSERTLDINASAQAQGLDPSDPAVLTLLNQSSEELKDAALNLLGPDGFSQLQDYQRTLPTRDFVNAIAGELAFTDSPLSAPQANELVRMLAAANLSYQNGGVADSPRVQNLMPLMATQSLAQEPVEWESVEAQAQSLLSPKQFALLNAAMQDSRSTVQLYNMLVQASDAPLLGYVYSVRR